MLLLDTSRALTCHGCGQVGPAPSPADNTAEARRRSTGFYLHPGPRGTVMVACCRCQQIQSPGLSGATESNQRSASPS